MSILLDDDNYAVRRWCTILNVAAFVVCMWMMFINVAVEAPTLIAMLLPFAALLVLRYYGDIVTLDDKRGVNTSPTVATSFILPSLFLAIRGLIYWHVLDWGNFWLPFAVIFGCMNGVALWLARDVLVRDKKIIYCLIACAAYGFGATLNLNGALDTSPHTTLSAVVVDKHIIKGRGTSYYLTLSAWGPRTAGRDVIVTAGVYNGHAIGSTATIDMRNGFFGMPYFFVR